MMPTEEEKLSSAVRSAEYWQSMYESEMQAKAEELDRVIQLRAELARSEARVKAALEYANGRWSEWGDRAEHVRDILEGNGNGNG